MGVAVTTLIPVLLACACACACAVVFVCSFISISAFQFLNFIIFEYVALDSDDLLYLKEQMEAEEDAERLLRRTEKRAFAAFKISFYYLIGGEVGLVWNEFFCDVLMWVMPLIYC